MQIKDLYLLTHIHLHIFFHFKNSIILNYSQVQISLMSYLGKLIYLDYFQLKHFDIKAYF